MLATIDASTVHTAGATTVSASNHDDATGDSSSITAIGIALGIAAGGAGGVSVNVSGAGVIAFNEVQGDIEASIVDSGVTAGGDVKRMNYVPVGTGGEMLPLVMSGKVTVATGGLNEVAGQFKAGKLRPIGISSPERLPGVDIPTFKEQGIDLVLTNWRSVVAPPGITDAQKKALADAVEKMAKSQAWKDILKQKGWDDAYLAGDGFAQFLKDEQKRVEQVLRSVGLVKS